MEFLVFKGRFCRDVFGMKVVYTRIYERVFAAALAARAPFLSAQFLLLDQEQPRSELVWIHRRIFASSLIDSYRDALHSLNLDAMSRARGPAPSLAHESRISNRGDDNWLAKVARPDPAARLVCPPKQMPRSVVWCGVGGFDTACDNAVRGCVVERGMRGSIRS